MGLSNQKAYLITFILHTTGNEQLDFHIIELSVDINTASGLCLLEIRGIFAGQLNTEEW